MELCVLKVWMSCLSLFWTATREKFLMMSLPRLSIQSGQRRTSSCGGTCVACYVTGISCVLVYVVCANHLRRWTTNTNALIAAHHAAAKKTLITTVVIDTFAALARKDVVVDAVSDDYPTPVLDGVACYVIGSSCVLIYMLCAMTLSETASQPRGDQRPRDWAPVSCRGHSCVPVGQWSP